MEPDGVTSERDAGSADDTSNEVVVEPSVEQVTLDEQTEDILHRSEMITETLPPALVEPEVPNPFVVDDSEDEYDEEEERRYSRESEQRRSLVGEDEGETLDAEHEIALAQSIILESSLNVNAQMPSPSVRSVPEDTAESTAEPSDASRLVYDDQDVEEEDDSEEDDGPPELYLPGLILPTMFLPIPNVRSFAVCMIVHEIPNLNCTQTDPLTSLLTKYIPPEKRPARDVSGDWQHSDFHTLVVSIIVSSTKRQYNQNVELARVDDQQLACTCSYGPRSHCPVQPN